MRKIRHCAHWLHPACHWTCDTGKDHAKATNTRHLYSELPDVCKDYHTAAEHASTHGCTLSAPVCATWHGVEPRSIQ